MSVAEIRKELHKAIDEIDNAEILQAMLTLLIQKEIPGDNYALSEEQIKFLEESEAEYRTGKDKGETIEEFKKKMKKKYGV